MYSKVNFHSSLQHDSNFYCLPYCKDAELYFHENRPPVISINYISQLRIFYKICNVTRKYVNILILNYFSQFYI